MGNPLALRYFPWGVQVACAKCGALRERGLECAPCKRTYMREFQRRRRMQPGVREQDRLASSKYRSQHPEAIVRAATFVKHKQAWVASLKQGPCKDCKHTFRSCCMDFDHLGDKMMGIGRMASQSSHEAILAEIAKCDLICACCHRIRTYNRRAPGAVPHEKRLKVDAIKASTPCMDCGSYFPAVAMDFDHVRGHKLATISQMTAAKWKSVSWGQILVEMAKCDLVCANCHRVRTSNRRRGQGVTA